MKFPNMPKDEKTARTQMALMESEIDQINAEFDDSFSELSSSQVSVTVNLFHALSHDLSHLKNMDPEDRRDIMKVAFQYAEIALAQSMHRIAKAKMEDVFLFSDEIFDPEDK